MKFFKETDKKQQEVTFEDLQSIEFKDKTFHLSGNFGSKKHEFSQSIIRLGGKVRGIKKEGTAHLNLEKTDYFVCADLGVKEKGKVKPYGNKAIEVQKFNEDSNGRHIPIIREAVCLRLIEENQPPKP